MRIAHLLQMIYFLTHGQMKEAGEAYQRAHESKLELADPGPLGILADIEFSDLFFILAEDVYMWGEFDYHRARFLFELGLKFFKLDKQTHYKPADFASNLAILRRLLDSPDPLDVIETLLTVNHGHMTRWAQARIKADDDLAKGLR